MALLELKNLHVALEDGTDHGHIYPVTCGVATQHLGADRLLDAIVDDLPSPVQHGGLSLEDMTLEADAGAETFAYVFKTRADPFAGRINLFRVYQGTVSADSHLLNTRAHTKERMGQLLVPQGKDVSHTDAFGPGDIGAVAKLKETREQGESLLDRTMVYLSSNLGNASSHSTRNLPVLLAGGGFRHGQHLAFAGANAPPLSNLYVSMLQRLGIEADRFGSSTGTLTGLDVAG